MALGLGIRRNHAKIKVLNKCIAKKAIGQYTALSSAVHLESKTNYSMEVFKAQIQ